MHYTFRLLCSSHPEEAGGQDWKSNQPGIKERLTELQKAIEEDTQLKPEDKADLLKQVEALAVATKTSDPDKKESLVRQAKKIFKATLDSLPDTAKLAEACSKLLPIILGYWDLQNDSKDQIAYIELSSRSRVLSFCSIRFFAHE